MATREELDQLTSEELHDRATKHALRHGHIKFLWELAKMLPAAEAAAGELDEAHDDIESVFGRIDDNKAAREGETGDLLRPVYIDYLLEHGA